MAGMTLKAEIFSINKRAAADIVKNVCQQVMYGAIRVFLKACLARIPTRTGFLRGSFREIGPAFGLKSDAFGSKATIPFEYPGHKRETFESTLGKFFGSDKVKKLFKEREEASIAKNPESHRRRLAKIEREKNSGKKEYYTGDGGKTLKTPSSGVKFVTPVSEMLKGKGTSFTFNLQVDISYYRVMDFYGHKGHGPWGSLKAGEDAMLEYIRKNAPSQKLLIALLGTTTITLSSNSTVTRSEKKFEALGNLSDFKVQDNITDVGVAAEVLAGSQIEKQEQRQYHKDRILELRDRERDLQAKARAKQFRKKTLREDEAYGRERPQNE